MVYKSPCLVDSLRHSILESIETCTEVQDFEVLVLDEFALRVISSCCKMTDILEENIMMVEQLETRRKPMPTKGVIYLIQPTFSSAVVQ